MSLHGLHGIMHCTQATPFQPHACPDLAPIWDPQPIQTQFFQIVELSPVIPSSRNHPSHCWNMPHSAQQNRTFPIGCRPPRRRRRIMRASDLVPEAPAPQPARTVAEDPAAALAASMRRTTPAGSRHSHAWNTLDGASTAHRCAGEVALLAQSEQLLIKQI